MDSLCRKNIWTQITEDGTISTLIIKVNADIILVNDTEHGFIENNGKLIITRNGKTIGIIEKRNAVSLYYTTLCEKEKKIINSVIY